MEIISMNLVKTAIFFLILLYASIKDIKTREVQDFVPIMICITALINNSVQNIPYMIMGAILISIPQIIIAASNPGTYGGADIKIVASCAFYLGIIGGLVVLIVGLVTSLLYKILRCRMYRESSHKKKGIALIPHFMIGYFTFILIV